MSRSQLERHSPSGARVGPSGQLALIAVDKKQKTTTRAKSMLVLMK
jgi:hypothetical protein